MYPSVPPPLYLKLRLSHQGLVGALAMYGVDCVDNCHHQAGVEAPPSNCRAKAQPAWGLDEPGWVPPNDETLHAWLQACWQGRESARPSLAGPEVRTAPHCQELEPQCQELKCSPVRSSSPHQRWVTASAGGLITYCIDCIAALVPDCTGILLGQFRFGPQDGFFGQSAG